MGSLRSAPPKTKKQKLSLEHRESISRGVAAAWKRMPFKKRVARAKKLGLSHFATPGCISQSFVDPDFDEDC